MTALPPIAVAGLVTPRSSDYAAIALWSIRGIVHSAVKSNGRDQVVSIFLATVAIAFAPVLWPALWLHLVIRASAGRTRSYMTAQRDAVLAITTSADGWHIVDHVAARPGRRRGRILRKTLLAALTAAADQNGIAIHARAASASLARTYCEELPGLHDVGPAPIRGRQLRRDPIG